MTYLMTISELELTLSEDGQVSEEAGNVQACIAFSAEYATDFVISTGTSMPINVSTTQGVGKKINRQLSSVFYVRYNHCILNKTTQKFE